LEVAEAGTYIADLTTHYALILTVSCILFGLQLLYAIAGWIIKSNYEASIMLLKINSLLELGMFIALLVIYNLSIISMNHINLDMLSYIRGN
jgi:hypothetical protein